MNQRSSTPRLIRTRDSKDPVRLVISHNEARRRKPYVAKDMRGNLGEMSKLDNQRIDRAEARREEKTYKRGKWSYRSFVQPGQTNSLFCCIGCGREEGMPHMNNCPKR